MKTANKITKYLTGKAELLIVCVNKNAKNISHSYSKTQKQEPLKLYSVQNSSRNSYLRVQFLGRYFIDESNLHPQEQLHNIIFTRKIIIIKLIVVVTTSNPTLNFIKE